LQILFSSIAFYSALTAASASAKHFGVNDKVFLCSVHYCCSYKGFKLQQIFKLHAFVNFGCYVVGDMVADIDTLS